MTPQHRPTRALGYDPGADTALINITAQFPVTGTPVDDVDWVEVDGALFGVTLHMVEGLPGILEVIGCHALLGDDFCRRAVVSDGSDLVRITRRDGQWRLAFATDPDSTVTPVEEVAEGGAARPTHLDSGNVSMDVEYHPNSTVRTMTLDVH